MNKFSKYLLFGVAIFIIATIVFSPISHADIETGVVVDGSMYSDDPIEINIAPSGSKALNGVDNLVGAKNKLVTLDNKDKYVINHYKDSDNNTYKLIYGKGVQNNPTDTKNCYVNGELVKMPRFYGKDGITNLTIVYDVYLHSEETVVFNNTIGDKFTTITNNLGVNDTWSNNGKVFDNQISGLEFINTTDGNYTFSHWVNDAGETVHNWFIGWENGARRIYNFFAVYDFTPNPDPITPVENNTTDNETVPVDNGTDNGTVPNSTDNSTEPVENETIDNGTEPIDNGTVPIDNGTGNETVPVDNSSDNTTIIDNTTKDNDTNSIKPANNQTANTNNDTTATNTKIDTNTSIANSKNPVVSTNLSEHETGVRFVVASIGVLLCLMLVLIGLRDDW